MLKDGLEGLGGPGWGGGQGQRLEVPLGPALLHWAGRDTGVR